MQNSLNLFSERKNTQSKLVSYLIHPGHKLALLPPSPKKWWCILLVLLVSSETNCFSRILTPK
ncbi:hypothetical protein AAZX31_06G252800 [Glycine max]